MLLSRHKRFLLLVVLFAIIITIWIFELMHDKVPFVDAWTRFVVPLVDGTVIYDAFFFITNFGSRSFVEPFTVFMAFLLVWITRDWLPSIFFAVGTLGSHLLNSSIKHIVARERPRILVEANAEGYSFPSGHAMVSIVCYGLLAYFIARECKTRAEKLIIEWSFITFILLIGVSRFFINVHYLTDILTGFFVGYTFLVILVYIFEKIEKRRGRGERLRLKTE